MVVFTNRRTGGREKALFLAAQSALGVIVDDFTAAGSMRVWSEVASYDPALVPQDPTDGFMTQDLAPPEASEHDTTEGPSGRFIAQLNPQLAEFLLRSHWGSFAAGAFTLKPTINEYFTVAMVEDSNTDGGSTKRLVRHRDAWLHNLAIRIDFNGKILADAEWAGRARSNRLLDALAGVTLPAAPMAPSDQNVFEGRAARLFRDPDGDNEEIFPGELSVIFNGRVLSESTMSDGWTVNKGGWQSVRLELAAALSDETWKITDRINSRTREKWRLDLVAPNPAKTLRFDFYAVGWKRPAKGHTGQQDDGFLASADIHVDDSTGKYVDITLT